MFIGTEKLTHTYMSGTPYAKEALRNITFSFEKGDFALIIGPSGSGKSTLIQHLNGLLRPSSGRVFFDHEAIGSDKHKLLQIRRRIGLVFQMPEEQFFSETVFDEIAFAPRNLGLEERLVRNRVNDALHKVDLDAGTFAGRHPFQLSAGQKRLVAIAAVLSLEPEVLILDEPTAGLDSAGRRTLFNLLTNLNRNERLTVIISTHHLDEVAALAGPVLVLKEGRLVMNGLAADIFIRRSELDELGLALPPVTEIMHNLFEAGLPVNMAVYSLTGAKEEIMKLKRRRD